ncbi:MAG: response regulator [Spirochaetia bacterium]|jgi:two-component system response regulator
MSGHYVLLVEDNPDDAALTVRAFKKSSIINELVIAKDGEEALAILFSGRALPELILLDLKLPKVDGLEVLRRLRREEKTRLLPVVILTSSREERDLMEGYALGANSYIQKPVDFEQFIEACHQLSLYWLVLNVPPPLKRS